MNRPQIHTRLLIHAARFEDVLQSRVEDHVDDGSLVIANPSVRGTVLTLALGEDVELEWTIKRGLARQRAAVRARVDVGVAGLVLEPLEEPRSVQRRDFVRVDAILPVLIEPPAGPPLTCTTLDVSGGGMRAVVSTPLADGTSVRATIELPTGESIACTASALRCLGEDVYAFAFEDIGTNDQERLIRFVFAYQRERLQEGRMAG